MGASFSATTLSPTRMSARAACESLATAVTRLRSSRVRPKSSEDRGVFSSSAECVAPSGLLGLGLGLGNLGPVRFGSGVRARSWGLGVRG